MARKNGKTALIAALALAHLHGPEAIPNGEIYSAANDRKQAAQVFKFAAQIVRSDPELLRDLRVIDSTKVIYCPSNGSRYEALSSETGTKHGLSPSMVIYDELAQAKKRDLFDVLDTAMGARFEPLFLTISTQSNDPEHILSKLIDDGLNGDDPSIVCHLYAAREDCDLDDEEQWAAANPALGDFRDREDLRQMVEKAKRLPAEEPKVRNLLLNQRVSPHSALISRVEWMACRRTVAIEDGEAVYLALDMSSVNDLTSLMIASADPQDTRLLPLFWKPGAVLQEHSKRDFGSGERRYVQWRDEGHLLTSGERAIDPLDVAMKIADLTQRFRVLGLAYDRWRIRDLMREFDRVGLATHAEGDKDPSGLRIVPWGQGYRDMAPAIDALEAEIIKGHLSHPGNPVLNWNLANAIAVADPAGNRKIDKSKVRFRIDGAVTAAMVLGLKAKDRSVSVPVDVMAMIV